MLRPINAARAARVANVNGLDARCVRGRTSNIRSETRARDNRFRHIVAKPEILTDREPWLSRGNCVAGSATARNKPAAFARQLRNRQSGIPKKSVKACAAAKH
ncbi:hypothetical protein [Caballeronia ptereochthonis]|uniref:hypothetical protein n=1 Tax=Caballeronia ptereochthonis TaxID=1777144 RepID=UPI000ABB7F27|nr:hypothetical protein [Caballeronia ptereochthonis]